MSHGRSRRLVLGRSGLGGASRRACRFQDLDELHGQRSRTLVRRHLRDAARALATCAGAPNPAADAFDLFLRADPLRWIEVAPHARVIAQQRRGAMAELLGHVRWRLAFVDQQRGKARAQVSRAYARCSVVLASAKASRRGCRAKRSSSPVVPVVAGPVVAAGVRDHGGVLGRMAACLAPGLEVIGQGSEEACRSLVRDAALGRSNEDCAAPDRGPGQRERLGLRAWAGVREQADQRGRA